MNENELDMLNRSIANEFRNLRKSQGKTQYQVACELGINSTYLGSIELAKRSKVSQYMYLKLANYYGVSYSKIIKVAEVKINLNNIYINT